MARGKGAIWRAAYPLLFHDGALPVARRVGLARTASSKGLNSTGIASDVFLRLYMNACMADGGGAALRAAYPLLFDDGPPPAVRPVAGPARPLWMTKEEGGAGAADVTRPAEVTARDQHMAVLGGAAAAAEKRARKQRRLERRQRKEEKRKEKKAKKRRKGGDA